MTERALRDVVEEKLGRDPFIDRERADVVIEGEEVSSGGRFRARVREKRRDGVVLGSREIEAESCSRLIRASGIVVALFVEPGRDHEGGEERVVTPAPESGEERDVTRTPESDHGQASARRGATSDHAVPGEAPEQDRTGPSRPQQAPAPSPPAPLHAPRRERAAPSAARHPFELSLGVGGSAAAGLLPSMSAAARGVARLERKRSRLSFEWSAGYSLPQSFRSRTVRGTFSAFDQQLRGCVSLTNPNADTKLDACGGAFWGAVIPDTAGVKARNDTWRALAGPAAALAAQLRDGTRAARLELGIAVPVVGRTLYYQSTEAAPERLYSTGTVIGFLGVSGLLTIL